MPAHESPDRAENYSPPPLDGSRPGWFNANAQGYKTRPIWAQGTLIAHEAVPGHHLQNARAAERGKLPKFRCAAWYGVYGEGWALYAETLGFELGLYKDPASRFGHLQDQMLRDRTRARLGDRFDIRRFHMVLLDQSAVPLSVLERLVDGWIAAEALRH